MAIFQKSVIQKYLKGLNTVWLNTAYDKFNEIFNSKKIEKIKNLKEEEYQDGFLRDLFVKVLGYTLKPEEDFNLVREFKNQTDGKKADGAIIKEEKAVAIIELKSTKTKDLTSITQQAFNYKINQPDCKYVITSNFQKLRFYIDYANEYEEFDLFNLQKSDFELLYLILRKKSIFSDTPQKLKEETRFHEEKISKQLYNDYSNFKNNIFENLVKNNPSIDKLKLFKKSQKLLDRLLFIFFAEDCGLLPPNSISRIIDRYEILKREDTYRPLYDIYKQYFGYMNIGRKGKIPADDIPAYNGGLFATDDFLDNLIIDDKILKNDCLKLSAYDFNTEVDVNILGQIFEHSLNEIEEMENKLSEKDEILEPKISKRKKDGVFYTPKHITQYIIENTIGTLCIKKRKEMNIYEIEFDDTYRTKKGLNKKGKELYDKLNDYKKWLLSLKILDPACGSGAFLNQALQFLITEHKLIDDFIADLTKQKIRLFDTDKAILEINLFGVDINEESVEIAKLSLWIRTAQKGRHLSYLSNNIKCGNSLIDDIKIAGDKAFDWNIEFKKIMDNGGFDVVLGNPPYRIVFETEIKKYLETTYPTFRRNNDLYVAFFEKSLQLLKDKRYFSFITPNSYIKGDYFKDLRNKLIEFQLMVIVDFGNKIIFKDANVFTAIVCLQKTKQKAGWLMKSNLEKEKGYVKSNTNNFIAKNGLFLKLSKFEKFNTFFLIKDVGYNYWSKGRRKKRGFGSIGDKVFYSGIQKDNKDIPYLKGSRIKKYYYSKPINFLKSNYTVFLNDNDTFRFTQKILETKPKIVYRQTSSNLIGTIDYQAYHTDKTVHTIIQQNDFKNDIDLKFVLILFNSNLMNYYYSILTEEAGRVFAQVKTIFVKDLPYKHIDIEQQQPFIKKADEMLLLNKELYTKSEKFIKRIKSNTELEKLSNKLKTFYNYDFKTFVKEFKKKKIKLSFSQQDEWEDYFERYKTEINELQNQINETDNEIDKMVYKLYELTTEEIAIIENEIN